MTTATTAPITFPDDLVRHAHPIPDVAWFQYEFPNGYGASVIRGALTYGGDQGLWELAVTHGRPLCYATPVTNDVIGYLSEEGVTETLVAIAALPANGACTHDR